MKMYVWSKQPTFLAVAQAESVDAARRLLLGQIGAGNDGSCFERETAARWVKETTPAIWIGPNAEFTLSDSAKLREVEAMAERRRLRLKANGIADTEDLNQGESNGKP